MTMRRWAVDALEEDSVRIQEDGLRMLTIPRHLIPHGAREGDVLRVEVVAPVSDRALTVSVSLDEAATREAHARSASVTERAMAESRKRDPGGDVSF